MLKSLQKKSGSAVLGQKGGQNGVFVIFLKNGSNDFVHIMHEVRGVQGVKSGRIRFLGKIRFWPKMAKNGSVQYPHVPIFTVISYNRTHEDSEHGIS